MLGVLYITRGRKVEREKRQAQRGLSPVYNSRVRKPGFAVETEVKLRIADPRDLRQRLRAMKAVRTQQVFERNILFDTANSRLRKQGILLRLREEFAVAGNRRLSTVMTVKGPSLRHSRYKRRAEMETIVADAEACKRLLRALGFRPMLRYEKIRTSFKLQQAPALHLEWDVTPIGEFLELEGTGRTIDRAARLLGFATSDYILKSYLGLFADYCRRRKITGRKMVFRGGKKRAKR